MNSIRIRNLRNILDSNEIHLLPITILVGANGSGKSSILRAFPLLRQSIETPTDSPLLWYGRLVDFGSVGAAANFENRTEGVEFQFGFEINSSFRISRYSNSDQLPIKVSLQIVESPQHDSSWVSKCGIFVGKDSATINFSEDTKVKSFFVNQIEIFSKSILHASSSAFFVPSIRERDREEQNRKVVFQPFTSSPRRDLEYYSESWQLRVQALEQKFFTEIQKLCHGNTSEYNVTQMLYNLPVFSQEMMLSNLKQWNGGKLWEKNVRDLTIDSSQFKSLRDHAIACFIPILLRRADEKIAEFANNVNYIGPFRAFARRYYRVQDLSVHEVDFQGENLAMFLRSLSESQRDDFSQFSLKHFGFEIRPESSEGHIAICLQRPGGPKVNLADTGFGYSQLLPVIAQVWATFSLNPRKVEKGQFGAFLAIEQPELHLHPAHQAALADLFVGAATDPRNLNKNFRFIIETHSEALVNRLGRLVGKGILKQDDVQILVFAKADNRENCLISRAVFNSEGGLCNWPYGFFSPES